MRGLRKKPDVDVHLYGRDINLKLVDIGGVDLEAALRELHEYASRADRLAKSSAEEAISRTSFILSRFRDPSSLIRRLRRHRSSQTLSLPRPAGRAAEA
jgi:hypothetical protein